MKARLDQIDTISSVMKAAGDKMVTNAGTASASGVKSRRSKGRKKHGPFVEVKYGSAVVPIYQTQSKGRQ